MSYFFPKPQPLSPSRKVITENGINYIHYKNGNKKRVRGVLYTQSLYYMWFEYLKRSENYKKACAENGKGMEKIYSDFGNVFEYEGEQGFWQWWTKKGDYLFGVRTSLDAERVVDWERIAGVQELFESGDVSILIVPNSTPKAKLLKQIQNLLKDVPLTELIGHRANYLPNNLKVDVESLRTALIAYDLKQEGKKNLEIGAFFSLSESDSKNYLRDGRKKGSKELSIQGEVDRIRKMNLSRIEYDALVDADDKTAEDRAKTRSRKKNTLNLIASRLIRKARANIAAVERGVFPVGHNE